MVRVTEFLLQVEKHSRNIGLESITNVNVIRKKNLLLVRLRSDLVRQQWLLVKMLTYEILSDSLKVKSIADSSPKILRDARQGNFNVGSCLPASVNLLSFHKEHSSKNSRNRNDRLNIDSESKLNYRNTNREYKHEEDKSSHAYKTRSSNKICYLCHRLDHIAICCENVTCNDCGKRGYIARHTIHMYLSRSKEAVVVITVIVLKENLLLSDLPRI